MTAAAPGRHVPHAPVRDTRGRPLRDLRISVTDRCNFRCVYCMPKALFGAAHRFLDRKDLLSFEEIERIARLFAEGGVRKLRITGGEPLLRRDIDVLVGMLSAVPGIEDISLTTNGALLTPAMAERLRAAGLRRITVSLDAIDDATFRRVNDVNFPVARVLEAIETAAGAGLRPVKINMVVKRGENEQEILPMVERFRGSGHILRFIEYMDVGNTNGWEMRDVVPGREILERIGEVHPLEPVPASYPGEVARRWRFRDGQGEIGVITSVTQPFCGGCTRARLSAEGKLYTCLFASEGTDLRAVVREGAGDEELRAVLDRVWSRREDRYSELRTLATRSPDALLGQTAGAPADRRKIEMSYIGG